MLTYTYRLNTSIPYKVEENGELKTGKTKVLWCQLAYLLFQKGNSLTFKYWAGDLASRKGYSTFGIKKIKKLATQTNLTIDFDGTSLLQVDLNEDVKNYVLHNIYKSEECLSPFFHFDVLDESGEPLCTSQNFGSSILMVLSVSDLRVLAADGFDLNFLISLPES